MSDREENEGESSEKAKMENARWGYQVAAGLWSSRASELWSQFGAMLTANSIVLAADAVALSKGTLPILAIGMPIVGLVLCFLWLLMHVRGVSYTEYWALSARELEEQYLKKPVISLHRGGDWSNGKTVSIKLDGKVTKKRMKTLGRILHVQSVAYLVIMTFAIMNMLLLLTAILSD